MTTLPSSPGVWIRWLVEFGGAAPGDVERLPRVLAEVFISRGSAVVVDEADVPSAAKKRGAS